VYGSHGVGCPPTPSGCPHPTELLVSVGAFEATSDGWQVAKLNRSMSLHNGTFWLAHWWPDGGSQTWRTARAAGLTSRGTMAAPDGLLPQVSRFWGNWTAQGAVPLVAEWVAEGDWCDVGGSLPPPVVAHVGDKGGGRITEPGAFLQGNQIYHNVTITDNVFVAPTAKTLVALNDGLQSGEDKTYTWSENFIHLGAIDGLMLSGNQMVLPAGLQRAGADIVLYSNTPQVAKDNACFVDSVPVACNTSSAPATLHLIGQAN
jgi:hypothetical protein